VEAPCARGYLLTAFIRGAHESFGDDGIADIVSRLDEGTRARTFELNGPPGKWIPEQDLITCSFAIWEGPACRDRARYNKFLQAQVHHGTGRVQRALISLASAKRVIDRAPAIWSAEHTHGKLEAEHHSETSASLRLRDHPYVETPQARATIAEVFRYIVSLTRAADVTETHALDGPEAVIVRLVWK
jgi:hypothetical protein